MNLTVKPWSQTLALATVWALAAAPVAAKPAGPQAAETGDIVLQPHRAVYDLALDESASGSGVVAVTGRIVYELTGSPCEGYAQTMRFVTVTSNQEGEQQTTDLRNSSWEQVPATRLRFSSSSFQNEIPTEQTQGVAERATSSGPAVVDLKRPQRRKAALDGNIYFPIQHSIEVLKAARSGRHILVADLFDGSETGEKVYATSTAIGREIKPGEGAPITLSASSEGLSKTPSWPIQMSYFKQGKTSGEALPLYEMSYRLHANGVTSSLRIDHGDFSIKGELKDLVFLEAKSCK